MLRKKIVPRKAKNKCLLGCQEAPEEAALCVDFPNKKLLFEQQLKHCSKFLKKNGELDSKSSRTNEGIPEHC